MLAYEEEKGFNNADIYKTFADNVKAVKVKLNSFIDDALKDGKTISGYGAPAKGNTLINYCDLDTSKLKYIVDDNPLKQNMLCPGSKIPCVPSSAHLCPRTKTKV